MGAQRLERLLGAVGRRREPVRAEADPGEEGDQRDVVEDARVVQVARLTEERRLEPREPPRRGQLSAVGARDLIRRQIVVDLPGFFFGGFLND